MTDTPQSGAQPEDAIPGLGEEVMYDAVPHDKVMRKRFRPLRFLGLLILGFFVFSTLSVAIHRFVPVPVTILMIEQRIQAAG